ALHQALRHRDAEAALLQAVALDPKLAVAHFNLGNLRRDLADLPGAVTAYAHALRLQPDYPEALKNIAVTLWESGHTAKAVASAALAVELHPESGGARLVLGEALRHAGRLSDAAAALEAARTYGADAVAVARNLSIVLVRLGDVAGAVA